LVRGEQETAGGLEALAYIMAVHQCLKWKFRNAGILLKSGTMIYHQKNGKVNGYSAY
jgi:hypothetical protein